MSKRWFRFYEEALNDPKVQRLPAERFRQWVNLLCMASRGNGSIDSRNVAFDLRVTDDEATKLVSELVSCNLIETFHETLPGNGAKQTQTFLKPHNWEIRQYKSDNSTDRVQRFRERKKLAEIGSVENTEEFETEIIHKTEEKQQRNVSRNEPVTPPETDTKSETESKNSSLRSPVGRKRRDPGARDQFERFWAAYPTRSGANPKHPAEKLFAAAVKSGADPHAIITGAVMYADEQKRIGKLGSEHVAQAKTWLNQRRWKDYPEQLEAGLEPAKAENSSGKFYAANGSRQLEAWDAYHREVGGKGWPRDKAGGWWMQSEWPPGFAAPAASASNDVGPMSDSSKVNRTHHAPTVGESAPRKSSNAALLAELAEI